MAICSAFSSFSKIHGNSPNIPHIGKTKASVMSQIPSKSTPNNAQKWSISQHHHPLVPTPSPRVTEELSVEKKWEIEDVRQLFFHNGVEPLEVLVMVDAIQRLGIEHHFQHEIRASLRKEYMELSNLGGDFGASLFEVALRFRLLRREGYYVHGDVFNKFKDKEGVFKSKDIKGLMELYEASQLSFEGEDILDEAMDFSSHALEAHQKAQLDHLQARLIGHTLAYPNHKSLPGFTSTNMQSYNLHGTSNDRWMPALCELASTHSSLMQSIHQMEIYQISRWWKELGLAKDLEFARDQPLKWYIWSMAALPNPSLSEERVDLTKPISLIYIIDDIFDVVGTLDELELFTQAIARWELNEQLPDYMRICFEALDKITCEIAQKINTKHGWNPINSLRKTWANLCNAFLVEARWFSSGCLPEEEEYLRNGIVSSGVQVVLVHVFFLLGEGINKEIVNYLDETPPVISSVATILRLWDDLGSAEDENQEGHDGSYIDCYMRKHSESTAEMARLQITKMISDAWKQLNRECLAPSRFSASFRRACLNLARMVPLMYTYDDNQGLPLLEEHMKSLLYGAVSP